MFIVKHLPWNQDVIAVRRQNPTTSFIPIGVERAVKCQSTERQKNVLSLPVNNARRRLLQVSIPVSTRLRVNALNGCFFLNMCSESFLSKPLHFLSIENRDETKKTIVTISHSRSFEPYCSPTMVYRDLWI